MSTHAANPPAATAVPLAPEKLFVVCAKIPLTTHDAPGLFMEMLGGQFLHRLLCLELKAAGLQFSDHGVVTTGLLHHAHASFLVRDVAAAARAVAPCLENWSAFFAVGYQDEREGIYRPLWPEKPAFDLNRYIPELIAAWKEEAPKHQGIFDQYAATLRRQLPPPEPPAAPAA